MEKIEDELLGFLELSKDLLFHSISPEKYKYYVKNSISHGREMAQQFKGHDVFEILENEGIEIKYVPSSGTYYNVRFRAQMVKQGKEYTIIIYLDTLDELVKNCSYYLPDMDRDLYAKTYIAHELFHYFEEKNNSDLSGCLEKVKTTKLFFWNIYHSVAACNEIAAHAFSKELVCLDNMPNLFDYLYLMSQGKISMDYFEKARNCYYN